MEALQILSRSEMKEIQAGYMQEPCRVYGANGWSSCSFSFKEAAGWHEDFPNDITGYCCASCGTGNFSNAEPC